MGQLRVDLNDLRENGQLGDWTFTENEDTIIIRLPAKGLDPRGILSPLPLKDTPDPNTDDWQWDHNREAPTLTPSINWVNVWHGYMRGGKLET